MSSEILTSISSERSAHTAGTELAKSASLFNSLLPSQPKGESFASTYEFVVNDETSQTQPGAQMTHRMPSSHFIADSFLVIDMNAPSVGTTCERVGLKILERMTVRNGSTVSEINSYSAVMSFILSRSSPSQRQQLLNAVGGASATAETIIVPLPVFWSPVYTGGIQKNNVNFPAFLCNAPVNLELNFASAASLLAPGGSWAGSPWSSVRVVHVQRQSHASVYNTVRQAGAWEYWTFDYQATSTKTTLPNGVETMIDVSEFDGSSAGIYLNPVTSASLTANDDYVLAEGITSIRSQLNGADFLRLDRTISANTSERVIEYLSYQWGVNAGSDTSDPTFSNRAKYLPFGGSITQGNNDDGQDNQINFESYYNLRDATRVAVFLTNDSGAELQTNLLNVRYAKFYISGGQLNRRK